MKLAICLWLIGMTASLAALPLLAHHSYAAFDISKRITVKGTVAKFEWTNPHSYLWVYVPKSASPREYELYGFENGPPSMMTRVGWTKSIFRAGDRVSIDYAPLKDGRNGGHLMQATLADGRVLQGDPAAPGGSGFGGKPPAEPVSQKP
jgi:hypothetical protein